MPATPTATGAAERLESLDMALLDAVNEIRTQHGLRPLILSPALQKAALFHSRAMVAGGFFKHDSQDGSSFVARLKRFYSPAGYASWSAGENLVYNTAELDTKSAMDAWLASPHHRANMLEPDWREVGVGSVYAGFAGGIFGGEPTWVVTMDFGTRVKVKPKKLRPTTNKLGSRI